jgi:protein TonB
MSEVCECMACKAELARVEELLWLFRGSVRQWSEQEFHAPRPPAIKSHNRRKAATASLLIHAGVLTLIVFAGTLPPVREAITSKITLIAPNPGPYLAQQHHGGGGGGDRSAAPVSRGSLPEPARRIFVPPMLRNNPDPKLVLDAGLVIPPDIPSVQSDQFGDPLARAGIPSNGGGYGGGMGDGGGGGVGPGTGVGYGPGYHGGWSDGAFVIGGGVSAPSVLRKVEPEYSEEARKAKYQGTVILYVIVDERGNARDVRVGRPLGLGLDQKAIEAVEKWKFRPGMKDGKPVAVHATIEVNFRLL